MTRKPNIFPLAICLGKISLLLLLLLLRLICLWQSFYGRWPKAWPRANFSRRMHKQSQMAKHIQHMRRIRIREIRGQQTECVLQLQIQIRLFIIRKWRQWLKFLMVSWPGSTEPSPVPTTPPPSLFPSPTCCSNCLQCA